MSHPKRMWSAAELSGVRGLKAQGLSLAEIARRIGRTTKAVSEKLSDVRRIQRRLLEGQKELDAESSPAALNRDTVIE